MKNIFRPPDPYLRGFKGRVIFSSNVDPDLRYWHNNWKVNTINKGLNLKNTLCKLCLTGWSFNAQPALFFNIFSSDLYFDVLIIGLF